MEWLYELHAREPWAPLAIGVAIAIICAGIFTWLIHRNDVR